MQKGSSPLAPDGCSCQTEPALTIRPPGRPLIPLVSLSDRKATAHLLQTNMFRLLRGIREHTEVENPFGVLGTDRAPSRWRGVSELITTPASISSCWELWSWIGGGGRTHLDGDT